MQIIIIITDRVKKIISPTAKAPTERLGSGDSNPHWFHITIFPVTAVNCLKIRQYSLHNLLCYRKNCLCETASTCLTEFLQRISVRKGAGGLTARQDRQGGRLCKNSVDRQCKFSSLLPRQWGLESALPGQERPNTVYAPFKQQKSTGRNDASLPHKYFSVYIQRGCWQINS